jgi:hypothetical protein
MTELEREKTMLNKIVKSLVVLTTLVTLGGCTKSTRVNYNLKQDANNFKVRRKVVALNTRTNEALFTVEGYISLETDSDGDLNVTIQTGENDYKLFYAHLSEDVTYTSIQLDSTETNEYAYEISFFPLKESIMHGLVDITSSEETE